MGSICTSEEPYRVGDTAEFALPTYNICDFEDARGAVLWISRHPEDRTVIYKDALPFDRDTIRASVPNDSLGPGNYIAKMWIGYVDSQTPGRKSYGEGACEFRIIDR